MLDESLKGQIRDTYQQLTESMQLKPRWGQRQMIAEIANSLGDPDSTCPIAVVEAGTGTGKTIAYLVAALPIARSQGKKLVIASATVALQEQLILRDLPDIMKHSRMDFNVRLAKGRGRYLCLTKLDLQLSSENTSSIIPLYPDEQLVKPQEKLLQISEAMVDSLNRDQWDGDFDSWPGVIDVDTQRLLATDQNQCTGRLCPHIKQCSFFRARDGLEDAEVIVTNHDLILADLRLGGGTILPAPEDCYYIFDEGHQLPTKCLDHFAHRFHAGSISDWISDTNQWISNRSDYWKVQGKSEQLLVALSESLKNIAQLTQDISYLFWEQMGDGFEEHAEHRFPFGRVPHAIILEAENLKKQWDALMDMSARLIDVSEGSVDHREDGALQNPDSNIDLINAQGLEARAKQQSAFWYSFADQSDDGTSFPGWARWCKHHGNLHSLECSVSPILPNNLLNDLLWKRTAGAVVTSATLAALGSFDRFMQSSGIPETARWKQVSSPFDPAKAVFCVPKMDSEPSDSQAHSLELIKLIPSLIQSDLGVLLLFTSRKQMDTVLSGLQECLQHQILVQGQVSKSVLLHQHRTNVERGKASAIFGLASFFEGIDLPGDYCRHVVISKLPFPFPDDPIAAAHAEFLEAQGRNPFMEISVPDASQRLLQASGRLLRTETDEGKITLLDSRVITRKYGQSILETLPKYTFKLGVEINIVDKSSPVRVLRKET